MRNMTWKNEIRKNMPPTFDEHGRDYEERGLDDDGNPIPKKDEFLEEMKYLLESYERMAGSPKQQLRKIKEMLEDCERELKRRKGD